SRFYLEQLLLMPDYLYVSYASSDLAANPQVASTAYNFLHDMINLKDDAEKTAEDAKEMEVGKPGLGHTLIEQVSNHANAYKVLLRTHGTKDDEKDAEDEDRIGQHSEEYVRMESKEAALQSILTEEDKEHWARLYETPEEGLKEKGLFFRGKHVSVSELETYFKCPYNFFVKYGLHATERKEAGVDPDETGSVIHRVLELLFKDIDIDQVTESDLKKHIETCVKTAISESRLGSLQDKAEFKSRVNRLKSEACYVANTEFALVKQSKFRPLGTEIKINGKKDGDKDGKDEIKLSDLPLKGSIDRVDACVDGDETLVAVIDYKTGNHLEDRLHDVFYGHKIQPYAYLYSLAKAGYKPVAAFYKKANGHFRETTDKMPPFAMHGQVVSDPHILKLFEPDLDSKPHGELIPVEMSPSGDVSSLRGAPDLLVPKELFQDIIDYTWALMDNAVKEIDGGYIDANPNEDGCRYCKAYGMCPQGKKTPKRKTSRTVSLGYFFNPDAHEMAENGKEEETK
ncbi:MAG: PD-(D/E)XK nuclease family protein, partial [Clostridia bacterium]|nr:PD-(D/E)XK nuclease family protein [Clostridia bacterium]